MRLTLRTMLCYLDDVLEPEDAKELGAKIEESEYASNVVHRIRTSMRRLRLGAPAASGKKVGLDPNTVADYLDNTLPAERVPDFERVCLDMESEIYLAEVAACHQILTLVLGEPAEVSPALRERMYALASGEHTSPTEDTSTVMARLADDSVPASSPAAAATTTSDEPAHREEAPPPATHPRHKPEVPEYLKAGGKRSLWPLVLTAALLLLLVGGALWATGALDAILHPKQVADMSARNADADKALFNVPADVNADKNGINRDNDEAAAPKDAAAEQDHAAGNTTDKDESVAGDGAAAGGNGAATEIDDSSAGGGDATAPTGDVAVEKTPQVPGVVDGGEPAIIGDAAPPPGDPIASEDAGEGPLLPPVDKIIGHYASTGQVIAFFDAETATWRRLPQRAAVKPGMQLQALPTYRPQLLLENKLQITFAGEATASISNPVDDVPAVVLHSGRALIATIGEAGNKLMLRAGERNATLTMGNVDAEIAVEVERFQLPGVDPRTQRSHVRMTATVARGQVEWLQEGADPVTLDAGQAISFVDESVANVQNGVEPPKWIKSNEIIDIDRLASATLEPLLDEERPLQVVLEEQAGQAAQSRVEVRSLATRCLASIGQFDRAIDSFNDESLKSYWQEHFNHLQQLLASSRPTAEAVALAVARRKGDQASRIYRLLWGFSPAQLQGGSDKILVEYLRNDALDVRVLAKENLQRITGKTFGYHAHFPEARRRTAQREWDQQAAVAGSIVYSVPPPELPPRTE